MTIFGRLQLVREVRVGDLLTAITILISLVGVLLSWSIDRHMRLGNEAKDIRVAAASTLADLETWSSLSLALFNEAQAAYVDASEAVTAAEKDHSRKHRVERARDLLWRRLNEIHTTILQKVVDEKVDTGYTRLFSYYPSVRPLYQDTLARLRKADVEMFQQLLTDLELAIVKFGNVDGDLASAEVGNALRSVANEAEAAFTQQVRAEMSSAESFLIDKIEADDGRLLDRPR